MIIGVDLGNYMVKVSTGYSFPSKCSRVPGIIGSKPFVTDETLYIGEGSFDTEYRKVKKEHIRTMFLYAVAKAGASNIRAVVGLPLSQYHADKEELKALLLSKRVNDVVLNNKPLKVTIDDLEVYPEGLAAIYGGSFCGVIIDLGGRTCDCSEILNGKVCNPFSIPRGTLNLESDFIKVLNSAGLDLKPDDAERIIKGGLKIDGKPVNIEKPLEVFKEFVNDLISRLQIEYSIRTRDVILIGGGCSLLYQVIQKRIPAAQIINNPVFANANGFRRVGDDLWH